MAWPIAGRKPKSKIADLPMRELRTEIARLEAVVGPCAPGAGARSRLERLKKEYQRRISKSGHVYIFCG